MHFTGKEKLGFLEITGPQNFQLLIDEPVTPNEKLVLRL